MSALRRLASTGVVGLCVLAGVLVLGSAPAFALREYLAPGSHFGSEGSGNGQFIEPAGVAVNDSREPLVEPAAGDVYVVDKGNNRVERFTAAGAYISQFDGSATPAGSFSAPELIAVDNSGSALDPSLWNVYVADSEHNVVDRFSSTGAYLGQLTGTCTAGPCTGEEAFGNLHGVAVDPSGNVWVYQGEENIDEFSQGGTFVRSFKTGRGAQPGMAIDGAGNIYVISGGEAALRFDAATGTEVAQFDGGVSGLAVDPSTGSVLVDRGGAIDLYGPAPERGAAPAQSFPEEGLAGSRGVAVSGAGVAYASQQGTDSVAFFDPTFLPTVDTGSATEAAATSATLNGSVNPEGEALSECRFEYGTEAPAYGQSAPCAQSPAGSSRVPVSAQVSGLQARTTYHFRLDAANANGAVSGRDETFFTVDAPLVEGEQAASVSPGGATLNAQVNASGLPTTYRVQYGTSTAYGSSTPEVSLGAPKGAVGIQARLSSLAPGTAYHYRVLARNALGSAAGTDATFTTPFSGAAVGLPDERAYELVSPLGNGEVFQPSTALGIATGEGELPLIANEPFRAAVDGSAMVYAGDAPASGVGGNGNQSSTTFLNNEYLAGRTGDGWTASDIEPPPAAEFLSSPVYQSFSSDLSTGYMSSSDRPTLAGAPPCAGADLYSRASAGGAFAALFTSTLTGRCGSPLFAGESSDGTHVLFQTSAALVAPAVPTSSGGFESHPCYEDCNLYESVGGVVRVVNLLPNGDVDTTATFGGPSGNGSHGIEQGENLPDLSNAISADGSRVVWSDVSTGIIYVRVGGVHTVQVSAGAARFWTASVDGRFVFYTEGERLERFDVESGAHEELAGSGAGVQGVVGTSEDGSFVYFVANDVLATGATPGTCKETYSGHPEQPVVTPRQEGEAARCGLYVLHVGEPVRFVATLAGTDDNLLHIIEGTEGIGLLGDWQSDLASKTAEVAADGHSVAFSSTLPLTGYDNVAPSDPEHRAVPELFVYSWEPNSGRLDCASCASNDAPPTTDLGGSPISQLLGYELGGWVRSSMWETFMGRWFSSDGSRVFFDTAQPLVAQDTNRLTDVYEWEREGAGSCRQAGGCIYLLSGGSSNDISLFLDASANGDDVFFMARAQLVAGDHDDSFHVFDARAPHVPGEAVGFPPVPGATCSGADCQGAPQAPPVFGAPSSATFGGAGNLAPPVSAARPKPKSKPKVCRRGFVKKHGRCVRQVRRSRAKAPGTHAKKGRK